MIMLSPHPNQIQAKPKRKRKLEAAHEWKSRTKIGSRRLKSALKIE